MPAATLVLVSSNEDLVSLCRDALGQLEQGRWRLIFSRDGVFNFSPDLCIWDYEPDREFTHSGKVADARNDLYLVSPADLSRFQAVLPKAEGKILLKPVTRAVLRAFLTSMIPHDGHEPSDRIDLLRADRDLILQSALKVNLKLQQYDKERTDFLAQAVHDLRTPLTALAGFSGLLASEQLGPISELQKDVLTRMEHSTKRIARMASTLFQLSIGQQVEQLPKRQRGNIHHCIEQAIHETTPLARSKGISLSSAQIRKPTGPLFFDASQMEQVLVNLLDNATKVTPQQGSIEVRGYSYFWERRGFDADMGIPERRAECDGEANSYRVDIEDSGPGVSEDCLEGIFEEYTRGAESASYRGGGLGLAICKRILHLHSGRVWAERRSGGALFSFVLPYGN